MANILAFIRSGPCASSDWLDDLGVRHDSDIGISVPRVFHDTPAEVRKELLGTRCEKINGRKSEDGCRVNDMLSKCATNPAAALSGSHKDAGEPRRVIRARVHLVVNQHR